MRPSSRPVCSMLLRKMLWPACLVSAVSCAAERSEPSTSQVPTLSDSLRIADSLRVLDSIRVADSVRVLDSIRVADSVAGAGSPPAGSPSPPAGSHSGMAFGAWSLWDPTMGWRGWPAPFTASVNWTDDTWIISHLDSARAAGHRLVLQMTDHPPSFYSTKGKFDLTKWKRDMDSYRSPPIQSAVERAVAEGTIIGASVLDEPKRTVWGGVLDKAMVDEMCSYVKGIFPTMPVGVVVVHWWRQDERYRVCDFIVSQYGWSQPPRGWGTPGGRGDVISWREEALRQAQHDGIAIAFSMNVINGGEELAKCVRSKTGGPGTYARHCRMTPKQVKDYGLALATAGCAMFIWRFDDLFMSNPANVAAIHDIAAVLAAKSPRSCRRPH
jgi:hypothetical protein